MSHYGCLQWSVPTLHNIVGCGMVSGRMNWVPWSVVTVWGVPNLEIQVLINACGMVAASIFLMVTALGHLEKWSKTRALGCDKDWKDSITFSRKDTGIKGRKSTPKTLQKCSTPPESKTNYLRRIDHSLLTSVFRKSSSETWAAASSDKLISGEKPINSILDNASAITLSDPWQCSMDVKKLKI